MDHSQHSQHQQNEANPLPSQSKRNIHLPQIRLQTSTEALGNQGDGSSVTDITGKSPKPVASTVSNLFYHRSAAELPVSQEDLHKSVTSVHHVKSTLSGKQDAVATANRSTHSVADEPSYYDLHGQPSAVRSQWSTKHVDDTPSVQPRNIHESTVPLKSNSRIDIHRPVTLTKSAVRTRLSNAEREADAPQISGKGPSTNALHATHSQLHLERVPSTASLEHMNGRNPDSQSLHNTVSTTHLEDLIGQSLSVTHKHNDHPKDPVFEKHKGQPIEPSSATLPAEKVGDEADVPKPRSARPSLMDSIPAKRMVLLNNGEKNQRGIPYVLNEKKIRTWDVLLREWTDRTKPSFGPVRRVYTPQGGTEITNLDGLRPNSVYVLTGSEKLKSMGYKVDDSLLATHFNHNFNYNKRRSESKPRTVPEKILPVFLSGDAIPERRQSVPTVLTINVHKNGDDINPPTKITLKKFDLWNLIRAKDSITDRVKPIGGMVKSIFSVNGTLIEHVTELQPNGYYVAVGQYENFRHVNYEPTGRHDHLLSTSAKFPKDTAAKAEIGAKRRRTFILRLKRKSLNQANNRDQYKGATTADAEQIHDPEHPEHPPMGMHTSGTKITEHQRIDLHSINPVPESKAHEYNHPHVETASDSTPINESGMQVHKHGERLHDAPSLAIHAAKSQNTNPSEHMVTQQKSGAIANTDPITEQSRLQLPAGGAQYLSPKPSKNLLRNTSKKDLHGSHTSGWSNTSNYKNALNEHLDDGSHTSINNADYHSFHVTGPSQASLVERDTPASIANLKDPASNQSVVSVQPVASQQSTRNNPSSISTAQKGGSAISIKTSNFAQKVPSSTSVTHESEHGVNGAADSNSSFVPHQSRVSVRSLPNPEDSVHNIQRPEEPLAQESVDPEEQPGEETKKSAARASAEKLDGSAEVAGTVLEQPSIAQEIKEPVKPRRKSKLGCC